MQDSLILAGGSSLAALVMIVKFLVSNFTNELKQFRKELAAERQARVEMVDSIRELAASIRVLRAEVRALPHSPPEASSNA